MLAEFDGETARVNETHRFPNGPVRLLDGLHWDVLRLFDEIKAGIRRGWRTGTIASVGLDTWGVDFALLDRNGALIGNPHHYRDARTAGMPERAFHIVPRWEIFRRTGIQFMPWNTLFQLFSMAESGMDALERASTLVMIPDLFNYWLTGEIGCEYTDATTSQCYDPIAGGWAVDLLDRLGIPPRILPRIIPSGTVLGPVHPALADDLDAPGLEVIAPACHDTAAAIAAVPVTDTAFAYISSGTWSLVGTEIPAPLITVETLAGNLTNEGGVGGRVRLLRNVMGLWLLQECRRRWGRDDGAPPAYDALIAEADRAAPFRTVVNPDDARFVIPADMVAAIADACRESGERVPVTRGDVVRCILESLALRYRWVIERMDTVLRRTTRVIHIVGGGSRNTLLCRLTADATARPVVAGPAEATALGNALVQVQARGHVQSLDDIREVVRRSTTLAVYEPGGGGGWADAYERFLRLVGEAS
jgi:rhamnulokinase